MIEKTMLISDLFEIEGANQQAIADVLFGIGMHCLGCAMRNLETIEDAAAVHGIDPDKLVEALVEAAKTPA
ncbi:MAG: DUF1858 domain-containing protein [Clostridia bacterium]|nr:DUF1858 domain-containing protein [Clostridia bacterium]